jgi:hypothetical protein
MDPAGVYDAHYDEPSVLLCPASAVVLKPYAQLPLHCIARRLGLSLLRAILTD